MLYYRPTTISLHIQTRFVYYNVRPHDLSTKVVDILIRRIKADEGLSGSVQ